MERHENELSHHGVLGMKWGVRRYQNKDGSLTPAGKKRREKLELELNKLDNKSESKSSKPKTYKEMNSDELNSAVKRLELEKRYKELDRDVNPKTVSKGRQFVEKFRDEALIPATVNAGKKLLESAIEKYGKQYLGIDVTDPVSKLKKEAEIAGYKKTIYESMTKEADYKSKYGKKEDADKQSEKTAKDNKKTDSDSETNTGKVFGEGASKKKTSEASNSKKKSETIIDAEWEDVTDSGKSFTSSMAKTPSSSLITDRNVSAGKSYISGLLEEPK